MKKKTLHFLTLFGLLLTFGAFSAGCGNGYDSQEAAAWDGRGGEVAQPEDDSELYIDTYGYFDYDEDGLGDDFNYEEDGLGDDLYDEYTPNPELYQVDVSEFAGTWYYDGDYAASTFLVIDRYGNWSYYERAEGEAEATEMDYGTFTYSTSEGSVYYANSSVYANVSYRVFEFDRGMLIWDDYGAYERME